MWDWIDTILRGGLHTIGGAIAGGFLTYIFQGYRIRKIKRQLQAVRAQRGLTEIVLIISCPCNIRVDVEKYLLKQTNNSTLPPIYEVHRQESLPQDQNEWMRFLNKIKYEINKARRECSPNRILLFINAPVALAVFVGAMLDNGPEVVVHHFFNGQYEPVSYLAHETIKLF
jgi:hypothetical protein